MTIDDFRVFSFSMFTNVHILIPAVTTTIDNSVCLKCGIIQKSGKASCCGHGGSWFKSCGGAGNTNLDRTWYEGIKACKAQPQSVAQQVNAAQQKGNYPSNDVDIVNSKSVSTSTPTSVTTVVIESTNAPAITSTTKSTRVPVDTPTSMFVPADHASASTSSHIVVNARSHTSESTSIIVQGCENLLEITTHVSILLLLILE